MNLTKEDIINALIGVGISVKKSWDGETHFYDEDGKEIFFPEDFNICWNIVDK